MFCLTFHRSWNNIRFDGSIICELAVLCVVDCVMHWWLIFTVLFSFCLSWCYRHFSCYAFRTCIFIVLFSFCLSWYYRHFSSFTYLCIVVLILLHNVALVIIPKNVIQFRILNYMWIMTQFRINITVSILLHKMLINLMFNVLISRVCAMNVNFPYG